MGQKAGSAKPMQKNQLNKLKPSASLKTKLEKIKLIFDVDKVVHIRTDIYSIAKYYRINQLAYSIFHNKDGFVHMGISRNGSYNKNDLTEQPKIVQKYITSLKAENILELATGKGASSDYLARNNPNIKFCAIDLPNGQLDAAFKKAKKLNNFFPKEGDFHNLGTYKSKFFDIVFVFESLCHSTNKTKVLREVKRILKDTGVFIIIDAYLAKPVAGYQKEEILAKNLVEKGMLVEDFEFYGKFKKTIDSEGFKILDEEDASELIMPTLKRFEHQASLLFSLPKLFTKKVIKILPHELVNNAVSGYLMPNLIEEKIAKYTILVLGKKSSR